MSTYHAVHVIYTTEAEIVNTAKTAMEEVQSSGGLRSSQRNGSLFERMEDDSFARGCHEFVGPHSWVLVLPRHKLPGCNLG